MSAPRTLVLVAHPNLSTSRINAAMVKGIRDLPNVTVHDLYAEYPDFNIDVEREQALLLAHDRIILQFPMLWYNVPPLLKQWQDKVLAYGFAFTYDASPTQLGTRRALVAVSTGGPAPSYAAEGHNRATIEEFLRPVERTLQLCRFDHRGIVSLSGAIAPGVDDEELALHVESYRGALKSGHRPAVIGA